MRALIPTLRDYDLGHLRIIAESWGLDSLPGTAPDAAEELARGMLDPDTASEVLAGLPAEAAQILEELQRQEGRLPISDLIRRYGPLREMGPGRRDREKPWRDPVSPLEILWYHGLIARAFGEGPGGPQEFVFIPTELQPLLPKPSTRGPTRMGRAAAQPPSIVRLAQSTAVDDATTLLAAFRVRSLAESEMAGRLESLGRFMHHPRSTELLVALLQEEACLEGEPLRPASEAAGQFLKRPRAQALRSLQRAWKRTGRWNDLAHTPGLENPHDAWPNDPQQTRSIMVDFLAGLPRQTWWDLDSFVSDVREHHPAFQRPAGDFESWYLRDARSGAFLSGFDEWERVEGALLRFYVAGPLHWLGVVDLGFVQEDAGASCFRIGPLAEPFFDPQSALGGEEPDSFASVRLDGRISIPRRAPRPLRYQAARMTDWEDLQPEAYHYRLTPASLRRATEAGLEHRHILSVLEDLSGAPLPAPLLKALERWNSRGTEARLERRHLLRVKDENILESLYKYQGTAKWLGERLGSNTAVVREQDIERLRNAAAKLGLLIDLFDR